MAYPKKQLNLVGIIGLGKSGLSSFTRAKKLGIKVITFDDQIECPKIINKKEFINPKNWNWEKIDALIISPGIPYKHPKPHYSVNLAEEKKVEVISEVEFAIRTGNGENWIVITGTNGKTTTTSLLDHIFRLTKINFATGGNIGFPVSSLPKLGNKGYYVVELSSFQLETTPSLKCLISVILNISPDHIDRHKNFRKYFEAKSRAFLSTKNNGLAILGKDKIFEELLIKNSNKIKIKRITKSILFSEQKLNPNLKGIHNTENCEAIKYICDFLKIGPKIFSKGIKTFPGLPHRMQLIGTIVKIAFINDSKATNDLSSSKALNSYDNIFWCAGGISKQDGIRNCLENLKEVKHAFFFGECKKEFLDQSKEKIPSTLCTSLSDAVIKAFNMAKNYQKDVKYKNLTILLSPAASSFDQFLNYEERGNEFSKTFLKIFNKDNFTKTNLEEVKKINA